MLKLSERLAKSSQVKEQRAAEKQHLKLSDDGAKLAERISAIPKRIDIKTMEMAVGVFNNEGDPKILEKIMQKKSNRVLLELAREELQGEWIKTFRSMIAALPPSSRFAMQKITWPQWLDFGRSAGLDEQGVVQALKVIVVFSMKKK